MTNTVSNNTDLAPFAEFQRRIKIGGYVPGDDPKYVLGGAFDGGGMSTAHNVGVASILLNEGIIAVTDVLVGTSAGAKVAAATLAEQLPDTENIFLKSLVERKFINLWRILSDGKVPAMNLPMLHRMITEETPLDTGKIESSPTVLGIGITDLTNYLPVAVSSKTTSGEGITRALMKSIHMPWVAGPPPTEDGITWGDGGLSWMTTADVAKNLGATKIVEISNNPADKWKHHVVASAFVSLWIRKHGSPENASKYRKFTREQVEFMNNVRTDPNVTHIYPDIGNVSLPGTLCKDVSLLRQGYNIGQETARLALGYELKDRPAHPFTRKSFRNILGFTASASRTIIPLSV